MTKKTKKQTILVVDDEAGLRLALRRTLEQAGYNVIEAADGQEALQMILTTGGFDLIITDIKMPQRDGLSLIRTLKNAKVQIPVVVITAYPTTNHILESLLLDAQDFIEKPFNREQILTAVNRSLIRKRN